MTAPGWYTDPLDPAKQRWWDGASWGAPQPVDESQQAGHRAPRRSRRPLLLTVGAIVVLAAGAGTWVAVSGSSSGPSNFTLNGSIELSGSVAGVAGGVSTDEAEIVAINGCEGYNGFSDITVGGQVTITDESGKTIAVGELGSGTLTGSTCAFPITVSDVPPGRKFYKVEVTHRGGIQFTEKQMRDGDVAVTLDSN